MSNQQYDFARHLYYHTDKTQELIASEVGVSRKTISQWAKYGEWKKVKLAKLVSPSTLLHDLYVQLGDLNAAIASREPGKRIPTSQEAELIRKLVMSVKGIRQRSIGETLEVATELANYILPVDSSFASLVIRYAHNLVKERSVNVRLYDLGVVDQDDIDAEPAEAA